METRKLFCDIKSHTPASPRTLNKISQYFPIPYSKFSLRRRSQQTKGILPCTTIPQVRLSIEPCWISPYTVINLRSIITCPVRLIDGSKKTVLQAPFSRRNKICLKRPHDAIFHARPIMGKLRTEKEMWIEPGIFHCI